MPKKEIKLPNGFFKMPWQTFMLLKDHELTNAEFVLLAFLIGASDNELGACAYSYSTMAKILGTSRQRIKQTCDNLADKKLIKIEKQFNSKGLPGKFITLGGKRFPVYQLIYAPHYHEGLVRSDTPHHDDAPHRGDAGGCIEAMQGGCIEAMHNKTNLYKTNVDNTNNNLSNSLTEPDKPVTDKVDESLRDEARKRAKQRNAGNVEAYASRILENWTKQGITSVNELRSAEGRIANANRKRSNFRGRKPINEKLPDWAKQELEKSKKKPKKTDKSAPVNQDISRLMERLNDKTKNGKKNN